MDANFLETVLQKREQSKVQQKEQAQKQDTDTIIERLKEVQLAALMGGQQPKSSVILADSTDLGERVATLANHIDKLLSSKDGLKASTNQIAAIKELKQSLSKLSKENDNKELKKSLDSILAAVKAIKIPKTTASVVKVPEPKVVIQERPIDFSPLSKALEDLRPTDNGVNLNDFRAQDIKESDRDTQYVGFLHPTGAWFIIENQVKENKLRYLFGKKGYAKAFPKAPTYEYSLLDEAINALQT